MMAGDYNQTNQISATLGDALGRLGIDCQDHTVPIFLTGAIVVGGLLAFLATRSVKWGLLVKGERKKQYYGGFFWPTVYTFAINWAVLYFMQSKPTSCGLLGNAVYLGTLVVSLVVSFIPLLYFEVFSTSEYAKATMAIVERTQALTNGVYELLSVARETLIGYQERLMLGFFDRFKSDDAISVRDKDICLAIYGHKIDEACKQLASQELYLRRDRFEVIWDSLTAGVEYQSVCDLSSFSRLRLAAGAHLDSSYEALVQSWDRRVRRELNSLRQHKGTFQKILVYTPPVVPSDSNQPPPCYGAERKCDFTKCTKNEKCIVKPIATHWVRSAQTLRRTRPPAVDGTQQHSIHLVLREKIEQRVRNLNREFEQTASQRTLESIDIGLFGGAFVGEEFKVAAELDNEVMKDYIYRIRHDAILVSDLRTLFNATVTDDAIAVA